MDWSDKATTAYLLLFMASGWLEIIMVCSIPMIPLTVLDALPPQTPPWAAFLLTSLLMTELMIGGQAVVLYGTARAEERLRAAVLAAGRETAAGAPHEISEEDQT